LVWALQPTSDITFASEKKEIALYAEFKEIQEFPRNKQQQASELKKEGRQLYTVKPGDSLQGVCLSLNINCERVKELNNLTYPYSLRLGQSIVYETP
jgi:hypothetical protein